MTTPSIITLIHEQFFSLSLHHTYVHCGKINLTLYRQRKERSVPLKLYLAYVPKGNLSLSKRDENLTLRRTKQEYNHLQMTPGVHALG